jgi:hypothetical protein
MWQSSVSLYCSLMGAGSRSSLSHRTWNYLVWEIRSIFGKIMLVPSYATLRPGPEAGLVESLIGWSSEWARRQSDRAWVAASVPIGAGKPDLVLATFRSELTPLGKATAHHARLLAYLRGVRRASPSTISARLTMQLATVAATLQSLTDAGALIPAGESYELSLPWRQILPQITAVEAKVSDWKRAVCQASRNRVFAHQCFVALPLAVADRAAHDSLVREYQVGVLAIADDGSVRVVRPSPSRRPLTWFYYYYLALAIADNTGSMGAKTCHSSSGLMKQRTSIQSTSSLQL